MFANKTHKEGHEAMENGKIELSITLYTKALTESPDDYNIISDRAVAYLHMENQEKCMIDFDRAVELQPDYGYRYASRAFARSHFGDIDGAVEDYEKVVKLDPNDSLAYNNLGLLLEKKGYKIQAEERFERADKLSKMEDNLLEVVDEMEGNKKAEELTYSSDIGKEEESSTKGKEIKKIFTSRSQFKEFLRFIKNGFKLK